MHETQGPPNGISNIIHIPQSWRHMIDHKVIPEDVQCIQQLETWRKTTSSMTYTEEEKKEESVFSCTSACSLYFPRK